MLLTGFSIYPKLSKADFIKYFCVWCSSDTFWLKRVRICSICTPTTPVPTGVLKTISETNHPELVSDFTDLKTGSSPRPSPLHMSVTTSVGSPSDSHFWLTGRKVGGSHNPLRFESLLEWFIEVRKVFPYDYSFIAKGKIRRTSQLKRCIKQGLGGTVDLLYPSFGIKAF